jgi:hypothetical protein
VVEIQSHWTATRHKNQGIYPTVRRHCLRAPAHRFAIGRAIPYNQPSVNTVTTLGNYHDRSIDISVGTAALSRRDGLTPFVTAQDWSYARSFSNAIGPNLASMVETRHVCTEREKPFILTSGHSEVVVVGVKEERNLRS